MLQPGTPAPDFTLPATGNQTITLSALRGRPIILYFYPKDNTPGCTTQAIAFRDHYDQFQAHGALILGLSRDTLASHERFRQKHQLPFDLISDPDEVACRAYDVLREKVRYGKVTRGIERSTFLIAPDGTLARIWRNVKVEGHIAQILAVLAAPSSSA
ncbi:MAG: peroxiredoxin [Hydrogenophilus sp.]|nr:peroxiredoxin [Hydrogenophilus sp.]